MISGKKPRLIWAQSLDGCTGDCGICSNRVSSVDVPEKWSADLLGGGERQPRRNHGRTRRKGKIHRVQGEDDGDTFRLSGGFIQLGLERDQELPFKLSFEVNKNITLPARIIMDGPIDNNFFEKSFEVKPVPQPAE